MDTFKHGPHQECRLTGEGAPSCLGLGNMCHFLTGTFLLDLIILRALI